MVYMYMYKVKEPGLYNQYFQSFILYGGNKISDKDSLIEMVEYNFTTCLCISSGIVKKLNKLK